MFLISALGGSQVQIGGPTAAFVPVVFSVLERFGFGGLVLCTLLAGLMLIAAGLLRIGTLMKYMPQPVITGFTAGIAISILLSQVKDLLGLRMGAVPADFFGRIVSYGRHLSDYDGAAAIVAVTCIGLIVALRKSRPRWPGFLFAVAGATAVCALFGIPVETIGSRFGGIPAALPHLTVPRIPIERTRELFPSAFTADAYSTTCNSIRRVSRASWRPLLAVGGQYEIPNAGEALQPYFQQMTSVVFPNSGHFVPEEQPEALAKALNAFLGRS